MGNKIAIGFCPTCNNPLIYSSNPKKASSLVLRPVGGQYRGCSLRCPCCKTVVGVEETEGMFAGLRNLPLVGDLVC